MICPPLDGLSSSKSYQHEANYSAMINDIPFALKLTQVEPASPESEININKMLKKVSEYMNRKHESNYILYNLFSDRQLDHANNLFH